MKIAEEAFRIKADAHRPPGAPAQDDADPDPEETTEWLEALEAVVAHASVQRARFLLARLAEHARHLGVTNAAHPYSVYQNTIALEDQPPYPGDLAMEERITAIVRWNALAMVARANRAYGELGGHIASYASAAEIFEVGFNHFFRAGSANGEDGAQGRGDLVYFQPHSAPGVYARAFLEGRLDEARISRYRQEVGGGGLCSYPHPWLMPEFWQFPTGSMGLGPISAVYQARFLRYLEHRGIVQAAVETGAQTTARTAMQAAAQPAAQTAMQATAQPAVHTAMQTAAQPAAHTAMQTAVQPEGQTATQTAVQPEGQTATQTGTQPAAPATNRRVWGVFGDGEMDEPESLAALSLAAREGLDNLTFIINCNLQRLDGPVRGNGQIIQELEALFTGAGWNVIKVIWGSDWDALFARDHQHVLLRRFAQTVDGQYQTLGANDGAYNRAHFFGLEPELQALVAHMSPAEIDGLRRGGHDFRKLYAAFRAAVAHRGQPSVILAKTKKGYGMGQAGESRNTAHQQKKLDLDALKAFRARFALPLDDASLEAMRFYRPAEDSAELRYLRARRDALGGFLPRRQRAAEPVPVPPLATYAQFALHPDARENSTTTAVVRLFTNLLKDKTLGPRIVPIVADEARTFGMANLFRQIGIYSPHGQLYEPEDAGSMLYYRESKDGQLLEEGITEAGAIASWTAAATSYSVNGVAMLPFYIYYSMFGFQRVGDLIWAAADQRARGFLIGATAGRTTLAGEGLQHQDGSSHVMAATVPNCRAYDPAFASELAVIVDHGSRQMLEKQIDEFYYVSVTNENYVHAALAPGQEEDVIRGMRRYGVCAQREEDALSEPDEPAEPDVRLLGSGAILQEVIAAAQLLANDWGIASEIWSVTSFSELARDAREIEYRRLFGGADHAQNHVPDHKESHEHRHEESRKENHEQRHEESRKESHEQRHEEGRKGRHEQRHEESRKESHGQSHGEHREESHLSRCLAGTRPVIAASDYVRAYAQLIASYVSAPYVALGTDGFGRSDTRVALRRFFGVDRTHIALAALAALDANKHAQALQRYGIDPAPAMPWNT